MPDGGPCPNTVCGLDDREFSRVFTVCERSEDMWDAVRRYEYDEDHRWAGVLGQVLGGWLRADAPDLAGYDAVTTCALYTGPDAPRHWDYLRPVLDSAVRQAPVVRVEHDLIVKAAPTGRLLGLGVAERRVIAEGPLREALSVPQPGRVAGRRVLVFDDVYSEGYSLREMARALRRAGASEVAGLVPTRRKGC